MKNKEYQNKSIKVQTMRMLLLMSVLFVLICLLISLAMQQILLTNSGEYMAVASEKLKNQLELSYDKIYTFSMAIAGDDGIQDLMTAEIRKKTEHVKSTEEMIAYFKILDPSILDIALINESTYYSSIYSREELEELRELNREKQFSWLGVNKSGYKGASFFSPALIYGREIIVGGEDRGTVVISIDSSWFQLNGDEEMDSCYMLADESGVIYSFGSKDDAAMKIWESWTGKTQKGGVMDGFRKPYLIQGIYLDKMECWQISARDIRKLNGKLSVMTILIWSCVFVVAAFMFFLFRIINTRMVRPLHDFQAVIQRIREQGQRSVGKEEIFEGSGKDGCSEIRDIREEFGGMLQDIDMLNRKIFDTAVDLYEIKVQKQQAELSYLRSQIDPHFLYNTLEVLRKKAIERNAPELAQMALDMGNIFRYSTKGDTMVFLADEISIIKSYIHIQETRFQGKIKVYYFLPEDTMRLTVMKMLLQPLVENAVYHGLEPKEERGQLYIGARREGRLLIITIKDNGVGIEEQRLGRIRSELEAEQFDTSRHVGILNTQARIRLQYGPEFGITIESRKDDGTTVTMKVPAQEGDDYVSGIVSGR